MPKGVVGIISPWNYPLTMALCDGLPALLAGNAVVSKPDAQTMLTALLAAQLLDEAGFPPEVWQVVAGPGPEVGGAIVAHADYICFTGSTATGRKIAQGCAERLIGCSLELGGKNPMLVLRDADVHRAAEGAVRAVFSNAGQLCVSMERLFVADQVYDRFVDAFVSRTRALTLGASHDWSVDMGSLISQAQLDTVTAHVEDAVAKGARVLTGGRHRPDLGPFVYEPTILEGVSADMECFGKETFGPVVSLYRFHSEDEAVERANDGHYGLNASVYTRDGARGRAVARRITCGTVNVNEAYGATFGSLGAPMGGMRESGHGPAPGRRGHPPLHRGTVRRDAAAGADRPDVRHVGGDQRQGADRLPPPAQQAGPRVSSLRRPGHRVGLRRLRHRTAADREGLPGRRARGRRALRGRRLPGHVLRRQAVPLRAVAGDVRHPAHRHGQGLPDPRRRRRRRWVARLRQHALRAARRLLPRPVVVAHHRLEGRARALLRPGQADARRRRQPAPHAGRRGDEAGRRRHGGGRHVPPDPGRRLLRRARRAGRRAGRGPVLRWRRTGPQRLPQLRRVHDRLPAQRQEHAGQELPPPRRAGRGGGPPADHGDARPAPCGRRLRGDDPLDQGQAVAAYGHQDLHRRPGRLLRGRPRHPEAAPPAQGRGRPARHQRPPRAC